MSARRMPNRAARIAAALCLVVAAAWGARRAPRLSERLRRLRQRRLLPRRRALLPILAEGCCSADTPVLLRRRHLCRRARPVCQRRSQCLQRLRRPVRRRLRTGWLAVLRSARALRASAGDLHLRDRVPRRRAWTRLPSSCSALLCPRRRRRAAPRPRPWSIPRTAASAPARSCPRFARRARARGEWPLLLLGAGVVGRTRRATGACRHTAG
jgi:hypothetical protein